MRILLDIVENLTSSVRYIIGALVLCGLAVGLMMTVTASVVAPKVAESFAERAERITDKAIQAQQEQMRAEALAKEGWGYKAPSSGQAEDRPVPMDPADGGWGR